MEPVAHEDADPLADRSTDSAKLPSRDLSRLTAGPRQHHDDDGLPFWGCFVKSVRNEQSRAPTSRPNSLTAFREPGSSIVIPASYRTPFERASSVSDSYSPAMRRTIVLLLPVTAPTSSSGVVAYTSGPSFYQLFRSASDDGLPPRGHRKQGDDPLSLARGGAASGGDSVDRGSFREVTDPAPNGFALLHRVSYLRQPPLHSFFVFSKQQHRLSLPRR